jgi:hypothetical protein
MTSGMSSFSAIGSSDKDKRPASMRAMSRTSLIRSSKCSPALRIWSTDSTCGSLSSSICMTWANPRTALSGVRSSWLMRDRNSLLARLARSASCLASASASRDVASSSTW